MPFRQEALLEVGRKVEDRVTQMVDEELLGSLALGVSGRLGGKVGLAPRIFLKNPSPRCWTAWSCLPISIRASTTNPSLMTGK